MILLTRLDGARFGLNEEQIERIDETPTTVLVLSNGNRYLVTETLDEVLEHIADFRAMVLGRADRLGVDRSRRVARIPHLSVAPGGDADLED